MNQIWGSPPCGAKPHDDVVAIGGAGRREALPLCGEQTQARADTRGVRAAPRSTRHRDNAIEHLYGDRCYQGDRSQELPATLPTEHRSRSLALSILSTGDG